SARRRRRQGPGRPGRPAGGAALPPGHRRRRLHLGARAAPADPPGAPAGRALRPGRRPAGPDRRRAAHPAGRAPAGGDGPVSLVVRNRVPKAAELVADDLAGHILATGMKEGDVLPNEREMTERFGVGRGTLREALRLLE